MIFREPDNATTPLCGWQRRVGKRPWRSLSREQRVAVIVLAAAQIGLAVAAWADLARRPASAVRGGKRGWAWAIAVNFVGPIAYFRYGRRTRR
ncbi:PLDc N-terminal domain-containing protein [Actinokineospora fastidiosa]|nr:PLDc N-terminal domain-containing protein [Actinokineospora fastidiosa]